MFLGMDVFSGSYAMLPNYISMGSIGDISLADGTYDHLYLSSDPEKTSDNIYDDWTYSTKINANYNDNTLDGGNTAFSLKTTDTIVIKRREKDKMDWVTIYTIPVNSVDDFSFIKEYLYAKSGANYDFMIISSIGGIENSFETASCYCEFDGICLADKDVIYKTIFNIDPISFDRNKNDNVLELLNGRYPLVYSVDSNNYESGSISAFFTKVQDDSSLIDGYEAVKYRKEFVDWLTNKKPKILKLDNGDIKMIKVVGKVTESPEGCSELVKIQFSYTEIGDCDDEKYLYTNNLSDVVPNRW